jgi:hypothetical protein
MVREANAAARRVAAHVDAEHRNDVPEIMTTVSSWDVHYAIVTPGESDLDLMRATSTEAARAYYEQDRRERRHVTSRHLTELNGSWFCFHESVGHLEVVRAGTINPQSAILFPVWDDGIIGEIVWLRPGWAGERTDRLARALEVGRNLDEWMGRWAGGEIEGMLALVEQRCLSVVRTASLDSGARSLAVSRSKAEMARAMDPASVGNILDLERTALALTDWYAFAAYRMRVEAAGRTVDRELAAIYPVGPSGAFVGQLAYAIETVSRRESP